ncbi:hypothetical protein [Microbacterium testaceum]|nr:hypothetical protein [Microbacterium testaceum]
MTNPLPHDATEPDAQRQGARAPDDKVTARDVTIASAGFAAEVAKDVALDILWNILVWAALILAIAIPLVGLALGVLFLVLAIRGDRSKTLPVITIAFSVVAWAMMQSPLGMVGVLLASRS